MTDPPRSTHPKAQPKPKKHLVVFLVMGLLGTNLEVLSRVGTLVNYKTLNLSHGSLAGWTSVWMLPVYGIAGLLFGQINEWESIRKKSMVYQSLLALGIAWAIELLSGCVLNLWLGLNIWDYKDRMFNFQGQISLGSGLEFFFISPLVFWADDMVRWIAYGEEEPGSIASYYRGLLTLKDREDPPVVVPPPAPVPVVEPAPIAEPEPDRPRV